MARDLKGVQHGQVVIEVLLILPIFLAIVFMIMEIGNLAFRTLLIHHAAYEVARVASLTATDKASLNCSGPPSLRNSSYYQSVGRRMLRNAFVSMNELATLPLDTQSGCTNYDVEVTVEEQVPLVFPLTGIFLGKACDGSKNVLSRCIRGTVRMPIERPLFK